MSGWNAYIDNLMASSRAIKRAAILGVADGQVWAKDNSFVASEAECASFVRLFQQIEKVPQTGFDLEGKHYICPRAEETLIFGKKDTVGVFALKTNMAVVIAIFEGGSNEGQACRTAVEKMGEHLSKSGY